MKDEYIIINKTTIQKRIEELKEQIENKHQEIEKCVKEGSLSSERNRSFWGVNDCLISECHSQIFLLKQILSQSTLFTPEVEKAI